MRAPWIPVSCASYLFLHVPNLAYKVLTDLVINAIKRVYISLDKYADKYQIGYWLDSVKHLQNKCLITFCTRFYYFLHWQSYFIFLFRDSGPIDCLRSLHYSTCWTLGSLWYLDLSVNGMCSKVVCDKIWYSHDYISSTAFGHGIHRSLPITDHCTHWTRTLGGVLAPVITISGMIPWVLVQQWNVNIHSHDASYVLERKSMERSPSHNHVIQFLL